MPRPNLGRGFCFLSCYVLVLRVAIRTFQLLPFHNAGRVLTNEKVLPEQYSCRVTLNGRQLKIFSASWGIRSVPWKGPKWLRHHFPSSGIQVDAANLGPQTEETDYWSTTNDPTQFRAYVEDLHTGELISGVQVTGLRSGVSTTTDTNGLFTLDVPASFWKDKTPGTAKETLVLSKSGYKRYEYRNLILFPGLRQLDILLEKGTGTIVRENRSFRDSGSDDEFFSFPGPAPNRPEGNAAKILSFYIEPSVMEGGWVTIKQPGAEAIVKARGLMSVSIYFYSTGTGVGEMPPGEIGPLKKVTASPEGDTWEIEVPDVMATSFWASGIDAHGRRVKGFDLGNVGWHVDP